MCRILVGAGDPTPARCLCSRPCCALGRMMTSLRSLCLMIATLANAAALLARPGPQLTSRPPLPPRRSPALTMLSLVDSDSWCERVEACDGLAVVFFYAPWCRNCKAVRPALERVERRFSSAEGGAPAEASFFEVDFRAQAKLCYEQRVFQFPTVHFYLPGLGRVGRCALTAKQVRVRVKVKVRVRVRVRAGVRVEVKVRVRVNAEASDLVRHEQLGQPQAHEHAAGVGGDRGSPAQQQGVARAWVGLGFRLGPGLG